MAYDIYLKKNEEKRIVEGHSWVYANEVAKIEGKDKNGSLASVWSYNGRFIGKGYINHASKILPLLGNTESASGTATAAARYLQRPTAYLRLSSISTATTSPFSCYLSEWI